MAAQALAGCRSRVFNDHCRALILSVISNVMNLLNIPGHHQQAVKGFIIGLAVPLESLKRRLSSRS